LILFAHGARDPRWAEPFERLRQKIQAARPGLPVALAYLEVMTPDLGAAVDQMVASGCRRLRVVPVFLGQGAHVRRDLPELVEQAAARHAGLTMELALPLGESDAVLEQMAAICVDGMPR
jgi:sirohydrochlorin cobaltochelatase